MLVADIPRCLETYASLFPGADVFRASFSDAWHPNRSSNDPIEDFGAKSGVYIYSAPGDPDWNLSISDNKNPIWYIGKSRSSVRARVWANLGVLYEKDGAICNPIFRYHRWADDEKIKDNEIKQAIAGGEFVAYSIAIEPVGSNFAPEIVETYLLTCFYRSAGTLPVLNSLISQFKVPR